jgi:hypothetical protein
MLYTLSGDVTKICQTNEYAALSVGIFLSSSSLLLLLFSFFVFVRSLEFNYLDRQDLVQVWRLVQVITNPLTYKPYIDGTQSVID